MKFRIRYSCRFAIHVFPIHAVNLGQFLGNTDLYIYLHVNTDLDKLWSQTQLPLDVMDLK